MIPQLKRSENIQRERSAEGKRSSLETLGLFVNTSVTTMTMRCDWNGAGWRARWMARPDLIVHLNSWSRLGRQWPVPEVSGAAEIADDRTMGPSATGVVTPATSPERTTLTTEFASRCRTTPTTHWSAGYNETAKKNTHKRKGHGTKTT